MYLIDSNSEITTEIISKILQQFQTSDRVKLQQSYDYYRGNQKILNKKMSEGKPCNRVVVNYCKPVVDNYSGYIVGHPVTYSSDNNIEQIMAVLNYNDEPSENIDLLRNALIYGVAYECNYIDEDNKQRFTILDPRDCVPVYDNTLSNNLRYVIRFYLETLYDENIDNQKYIVEVYGDKTVKKYRSALGFTSFELIEEYVHHFNQCPITVFELNRDRESIFQQIISLQDAYNSILSDECDDIDSWADAYLVLKGCTAEEEDLVAMKKNRALILDSDAEAEYLVKQVNDTQIENILSNINDQIHKIANSPDLNDQEFAASTGIALKLKLTGLSNTASGIKNQMTKALQRRIELICDILKITDGIDGEEVWRDITIEFSDNIPEEIGTIATTINSLRGLVSTETLLGQLSFVKNPALEIEKLNSEKTANMELYGAQFNAVEEESENE